MGDSCCDEFSISTRNIGCRMENETYVKELMPLLISGVSIMVLLGLAFVVFIQIFNKKLLLEQTNKQNLLVKHQEELIQNNIRAQEKERHRIARDLHDDIGSKLSAVHLYMQSIKSQVKNIEVLNLVEEVDKILKKTSNSTKRISHNLLPPTLSSLGLISAIEELVEEISHDAKLQIIFTSVGNEKMRLKSSISEVNLFRIIQEWVSNSLKQNVTTIQLDIDNKEGLLIISYEDNGPGYDPLQVNNKSGMGLRNIENRVLMIDAKLINLSQLGVSAKYILSYKEVL